MLVEAIEVASTERPYEWFVFYNPDLWTILQGAHVNSLDQIEIAIPRDDGPVRVSLTGAGCFHRLALHVPRDAARARLMFLHNECGLSPEGGSAVEFVNRLTDAEVQAMTEISRSSAPVACHSRPGSTLPGYVADLWDIYSMVRPDRWP